MERADGNRAGLTKVMQSRCGWKGRMGRKTATYNPDNTKHK